MTGKPGFRDTLRTPSGFQGSYGEAINSGADLGENFAGAINLSGGSYDARRSPGNGWDIGAYENLPETGLRPDRHFRMAGYEVTYQLHDNTASVYTLKGRVLKKDVLMSGKGRITFDKNG